MYTVFRLTYNYLFRSTYSMNPIMMQISLGCPKFSMLRDFLSCPSASSSWRLSRFASPSPMMRTLLGTVQLSRSWWISNASVVPWVGGARWWRMFFGRLERSDGGFVCLFFVVATQLFFGIFTPKIGENGSNLRNIFSDGLVQPPTSLFFVCFCCCWKSWATCLACFIGSISLFPSQWK